VRGAVVGVIECVIVGGLVMGVLVAHAGGCAEVDLLRW
jgi:hypothetical protein